MDDFTFPDSRPDEAPIIRLVNTILVYGINNAASEIRIQLLAGAVPERAVKVFHLLPPAETWTEQMELPIYVFQAFRERLLEMVGNEDVINLTCQGKSYKLFPINLAEGDAQNSADGQTLILTLKPEIDSSI